MDHIMQLIWEIKRINGVLACMCVLRHMPEIFSVSEWSSITFSSSSAKITPTQLPPTKKTSFPSASFRDTMSGWCPEFTHLKAQMSPWTSVFTFKISDFFFSLVLPGSCDPKQCRYGVDLAFRKVIRFKTGIKSEIHERKCIFRDNSCHYLQMVMSLVYSNCDDNSQMLVFLIIKVRTRTYKYLNAQTGSQGP